MFYKYILHRKSPYCECCVLHDVRYRTGGTSRDRWLADNGLKSCIQATGRYTAANIFYFAVRWFGWPYFNWKD